MVYRLGRLALCGALALTMLGCSAQPPEKPVLPEPSASVPAGMKEVSRLEGHQKVDTVGEAQSSDSNVKSMSDGAKTGEKPKSEESAGSSDRQAKGMSEGGNVKPSDMSNDKSESSRNAGKTAEGGDDYQTVNTPTITSRGEFPWTLDAEKVQYSENNQRVRVSAIVWKLLDKNDQPRLTVRGRAADVNVESQNVAFDGPVDAEGSQGETMHVNRMVWDSAKQKILGSNGVRVVRKGTVMTGDRLTASPDLKQVEVSGNVHVSFVPAKVESAGDGDSVIYAGDGDPVF